MEAAWLDSMFPFLLSRKHNACRELKLRGEMIARATMTGGKPHGCIFPHESNPSLIQKTGTFPSDKLDFCLQEAFHERMNVIIQFLLVTN